MNIISDLALVVRDGALQVNESGRLAGELRHSEVPKWSREYEESFSHYDGMFI
jgi:hypothetical protein